MSIIALTQIVREMIYLRRRPDLSTDQIASSPHDVCVMNSDSCMCNLRMGKVAQINMLMMMKIIILHYYFYDVVVVQLLIHRQAGTFYSGLSFFFFLIVFLSIILLCCVNPRTQNNVITSSHCFMSCCSSALAVLFFAVIIDVPRSIYISAHVRISLPKTERLLFFYCEFQIQSHLMAIHSYDKWKCHFKSHLSSLIHWNWFFFSYSIDFCFFFYVVENFYAILVIKWVFQFCFQSFRLKDFQFIIRTSYHQPLG